MFIEQDQAVLLAGNAEAEDGLAVDSGGGQCLPGGLDKSVQPLPGVLLAATVGAADHVVWGRALAQHLAADGVEDDGLGALGTAIDTEIEFLIHAWPA